MRATLGSRWRRARLGCCSAQTVRREGCGLTEDDHLLGRIPDELQEDGGKDRDEIRFPAMRRTEVR